MIDEIDKEGENLPFVAGEKNPESGQILEIAKQRIEAGREVEQQERQNDDRVAEVRDIIEKVGGNKKIAPDPLTPEEQTGLDRHVANLKSEIGNKILSISKGNDTAADYDCHVLNYSTKTSLVKLDSGRRIFVVFNFPASWIHRKLDGLMKFFTGKKIKKADSKDWKDTFERRTQIPTIPNSDPNVVTMDYLPNVNLYDLFVNRKQKDNKGSPLIKDYGECEFARDIDLEGLLQVVEKVVDKAKSMHGKDVHWGELNLPNIIIDKDQEVHICDPETEYSEKVPVAERRARDLLVFLMSSSAAVNLTEDVDHSLTIKRALDRYGLDMDTRNELKKLVEKPMTLLQKLLFGYTKVNYGLKDRVEYEKIMKNIAEYLQ